MEVGFGFFTKLPLELRQNIWEIALASPWSVSKFSRASRRVKIVGSLHRDVGQACVEARSVMQRIFTCIRPFGWINVDRHLFFFRDLKFDRKLMQQLDTDYDIYAPIQHLVLNPRDWPEFWSSLNFILHRCQSLKSLVLIGPWIDPADAPDTPEGLDLAPYEDWSPLFHLSPTQIDLEPLLDDIHRGLSGIDEYGPQYRARLDDACARCSQIFDDISQPYRRTRRFIEETESAVQSSLGAKPHIYFRRFDQVALGREGRHGVFRANPPRRARATK